MRHGIRMFTGLLNGVFVGWLAGVAGFSVLASAGFAALSCAIMTVGLAVAAAI